MNLVLLLFHATRTRFTYQSSRIPISCAMVVFFLFSSDVVAQAPSSILPDLSGFKLTFPIDENGNDYEGVSFDDREDPLIKADEVDNLVGYTATGDYAPYFFVSGSEVVFRAHCAGALTSANSYPRCELRQTPAGTGDDDLWDMDDEQELNATFRATAVPDQKREVCMLQIKGADNIGGSSAKEPFRLEYRVDGNQGLHVVINESSSYGGGTVEDVMDYSLNQTIQARMYVNNRQITIEINNLQVSGSRGQWDTTFTVNSSFDDYGYFKAGAYTQSSIWSDKNGVADEDPDAYGEVRFSALTLGEVITGGGNLPSPWASTDVGSVGASGSASYSSGTFTLDGSGADIWGSSDEFQFVNQTASGDVTITAKVNSVENTNNWAKAGVMIRESLSGGSKHAMCVVTPSNGVSFQRRTSTNSSSAHTTNSGHNAPYWVRIQRSGNTFTSYRSSNGSSWTNMGSVTISMNSSVYVGLVTTSHNDGTLCTATLSDVTVTQQSSGSGTGLSATYYNNMGFSGSTVTRTDPTIDFSWGSGSPDGAIGVNTFSARWTGSVQADQSGTYTFYSTTDDGVRLWVNGQQIINKWVNQGPTEWSGSISLTAGVQVPIVMEYFENGGGAVAKLSWSASGVSKQIIPQANLYPGGTTGTTSCSGGTNLALNETIVSYSDQQSANPASKILNGTTANSDRWSASGFPQNTVIDLGATYSVDEINLMPYASRAYQFQVEGSTTSATSGFSIMTNATGNSSGGSVINRSFSARPVRYVRLTITGVSGNITTWSSIAEFEVICSGNSSRFAAEDIQPPVLTYSPNPFGQKGLFVQVPSEMESMTSIRAVDMLGRVVFEQHGLNPGDEIFILQQAQTGLYLLQWMTESNEILQTSKVLRQ